MDDPQARRARLGRWAVRRIPTREGLARNRMLAPLAHRFLPNELWRLTRRSVPRGVALGFVVAILVIVPGFQIVAAVLLAPLVRANVPTAAVATFLNTPPTTIPLLIGAKRLGDALLGWREGAALAGSSTHDWVRWLLSDAAPATALGLLAIASAAGLVGYAAASGLWRLWIANRWRHRHG